MNQELTKELLRIKSLLEVTMNQELTRSYYESRAY